MTAEDAVRGGPPGRGEDELTALAVPDEAVRNEAPEHLAGGLGGDAEAARDEGGGHASAVARADPQGQEVLLRRARQVGGRPAAAFRTAHARRIRPRLTTSTPIMPATQA